MKLSRIAFASLAAAGVSAALVIGCSDSTTPSPVAAADAAPKSDSGVPDVSTVPVPVKDAGEATDTGTTPASDAGMESGTVVDAGTDTGVDAACTPVTATFAGCTTFTDVAAGPGTIAFDNGNQTYSPKCLKIQKDKAVTWNGTFSSHPLKPACNPATGGTIPSTATGTTTSVTFTAPGFYGYYCNFHGSPTGTGMSGVIEVY